MANDNKSFFTAVASNPEPPATPQTTSGRKIMHKYKYTAINVNKQKFSGMFVAENEKHLRQQLAQQNLYLVNYSIASEKSPNPFFSVSGKISTSELTVFCRQMAIMLSSGISILNTLAQLKGHNFSGYFKSILEMIYEDVKVGKLINEAMKKHAKVFPEFFRSMIYVGEVSGSLENVLTSLADYYENEEALQRKIKGALAYPAFMSGLMVAIVLVMLLFVIPQFKDTLTLMDVQLDGLTKFVFDASDYLLANGLNLLYGVVIGFALIYVFFQTEKGKDFKDYVAYKIPLVRNIQINLVASKFTKSMALLLQSGMDLVESLEVVGNLLGNRYAQAEFKKLIEDVRQGASLTFSMESYNLFPTMLVQLISTGEETGDIDSVLARSMTYFDMQVEQALLKMTGVIQPLTLGLLGIVVGGMFIAIYSPMIAIMSTDFNKQTTTPSMAATVVNTILKLRR